MGTYMIQASSSGKGGAQSVTWHVDDVDWTPLTGLFIQKAGYKTVIAPEFTDNAYSIELTTVGPGGFSPTHVEPWAHVFYVLSGHGEVTVEDEVKEVRPGSVSPISAGQAHSFRNLGSGALEMLVIYHPPRVRKPAPASDRLLVVVERMALEADGVMSIELAARDGTDLPAFDPGSHVDLYLANGAVRSYSLCGYSPDRYRVAVSRDRASRGGSVFIHDTLRVGAALEISRPRNNFPLTEDAGHSVFIAGGIGITPLLSMVRRLAQLGRSAELIYAARSRREAAFAREVESLGVPVTWHFNDEQGGSPELESILRTRKKDAHFYACGPAAMLDAFEDLCAKLDLPNFHLERFTAGSTDVPSKASSPYTVQLAKSNRSIEVQGDRSLLDTLLAAGVDVPHSCKQGVCGTCKTRVLAGDPDHRDSVLTDEERRNGSVMTPCVSGCMTRELVLDL